MVNTNSTKDPVRAATHKDLTIQFSALGTLAISGPYVYKPADEKRVKSVSTQNVGFLGRGGNHLACYYRNDKSRGTVKTNLFYLWKAQLHLGLAPLRNGQPSPPHCHPLSLLFHFGSKVWEDQGGSEVSSALLLLPSRSERSHRI